MYSFGIRRLRVWEVSWGARIHSLHRIEEQGNFQNKARMLLWTSSHTSHRNVEGSDAVESFGKADFSILGFGLGVMASGRKLFIASSFLEAVPQEHGI